METDFEETFVDNNVKYDDFVRMIIEIFRKTIMYYVDILNLNSDDLDKISFNFVELLPNIFQEIGPGSYSLDVIVKNYIDAEVVPLYSKVLRTATNKVEYNLARAKRVKPDTPVPVSIPSKKVKMTKLGIKELVEKQELNMLSSKAFEELTPSDKQEAMQYAKAISDLMNFQAMLEKKHASLLEKKPTSFKRTMLSSSLGGEVPKSSRSLHLGLEKPGSVIPIPAYTEQQKNIQENLKLIMENKGPLPPKITLKDVAYMPNLRFKKLFQIHSQLPRSAYKEEKQPPQGGVFKTTDKTLWSADEDEEPMNFDEPIDFDKPTLNFTDDADNLQKLLERSIAAGRVPLQPAVNLAEKVTKMSEQVQNAADLQTELEAERYGFQGKTSTVAELIQAKQRGINVRAMSRIVGDNNFLSMVNKLNQPQNVRINTKAVLLAMKNVMNRLKYTKSFMLPEDEKVKVPTCLQQDNLYAIDLNHRIIPTYIPNFSSHGYDEFLFNCVTALTTANAEEKLGSAAVQMVTQTGMKLVEYANKVVYTNGSLEGMFGRIINVYKIRDLVLQEPVYFQNPFEKMAAHGLNGDFPSYAMHCKELFKSAISIWKKPDWLKIPTYSTGIYKEQNPWDNFTTTFSKEFGPISSIVSELESVGNSKQGTKEDGTPNLRSKWGVPDEFHYIHIVATSDPGIVWPNPLKRRDVLANDVRLGDYTLFQAMSNAMALQKGELKYFRLTEAKPKAEIYQRSEITEKTRVIQAYNSFSQLPSHIIYSGMFNTKFNCIEWEDTEGEQYSNVSMLGWSPFYNGMNNLVMEIMKLDFKQMVFADNIFALFKLNNKKYWVSMDGNKMEGCHTEGDFRLLAEWAIDWWGLEPKDVKKQKKDWINYLRFYDPAMAINPVCTLADVQFYGPGLGSGKVATGYLNTCKSVRFLDMWRALEYRKQNKNDADWYKNYKKFNRLPMKVNDKGDIDFTDTMTMAMRYVGISLKITAVTDVTTIERSPFLRLDCLGYDAINLGLTFPGVGWVAVLAEDRLFSSTVCLKSMLAEQQGTVSQFIKIAKMRMLYMIGGFLNPGLSIIMRSYIKELKSTIESNVNITLGNTNSQFELEELANLTLDQKDIKNLLFESFDIPTMRSLLKLHFGYTNDTARFIVPDEKIAVLMVQGRMTINSKPIYDKRCIEEFNDKGFSVPFKYVDYEKLDTNLSPEEIKIYKQHMDQDQTEKLHNFVRSKVKEGFKLNTTDQDVTIVAKDDSKVILLPEQPRVPELTPSTKGPEIMNVVNPTELKLKQERAAVEDALQRTEADRVLQAFYSLSDKPTILAKSLNEASHHVLMILSQVYGLPILAFGKIDRKSYKYEPSSFTPAMQPGDKFTTALKAKLDPKDVKDRIFNKIGEEVKKHSLERRTSVATTSVQGLQKRVLGVSNKKSKINIIRKH